MWQAVQISIAGICGVMAAILLLYCTVILAGFISGKTEKKKQGDGNE
ncbi:MAG: hypothetical protein ACLFQ9_06215 [Desulfobacterales bacterium]